MAELSPSEVDAAGRVAQGVGEAIAADSAKVVGDNSSAVSQGGLNIGPTLGGILPLWEAHLKKCGGDVESIGIGLRTSSGSYTVTAGFEYSGVQHVRDLMA